MTNNLTRRLSAQDAGFLYLERSNAPLHIGSLGIYEGELSYERFVQHLDARLPSIPRYRQRVAFVPFQLFHPTWEDDPDFEIRNHVHHVTLQSGGGEQQLAELAAELFARPLDRDRPLWEMFIINGLENGRSALLAKVHHCLVDGVSGIELLMATLDISPDPSPMPEPPPWDPGPLPDPNERLADAFWDQLSLQREALQEFVENLIDPWSRLQQTREVLDALDLTSTWSNQPSPETPFTVELGTERRLAFSDISFVEIREIRASLGGTVNDVVLAVLAGALRRYLILHDYDVEGLEFRVAIPVNVRVDEEQAELGNRISCMLAALPVGEPDPVKQLNIIRERLDQLKQANQAGGLAQLSRMAAYAPASIQALAGLAPPDNTMINLICTNVPGPMIPLYCVGRPMLAHYPLVPLSLNLGLSVGVTSYNHRLYFGLIADPNAVPDVENLKRCLDESFFELRSAAGVAPSEELSFRGQSGNHDGAAASTAVTD